MKPITYRRSSAAPCRSADPTYGAGFGRHPWAEETPGPTTMPAAREAWLAGAMRRLLRPAEQQVLRQAAEIMNRIADAQF
jgi:hypothetical protein